MKPKESLKEYRRALLQTIARDYRSQQVEANLPNYNPALCPLCDCLLSLCVGH